MERAAGGTRGGDVGAVPRNLIPLDNSAQGIAPGIETERRVGNDLVDTVDGDVFGPVEDDTVGVALERVGLHDRAAVVTQGVEPAAAAGEHLIAGAGAEGERFGILKQQGIGVGREGIAIERRAGEGAGGVEAVVVVLDLVGAVECQALSRGEIDPVGGSRDRIANDSRAAEAPGGVEADRIVPDLVGGPHRQPCGVVEIDTRAAVLHCVANETGAGERAGGEEAVTDAVDRVRGGIGPASDADAGGIGEEDAIASTTGDRIAGDAGAVALAADVDACG